MARKWKNSDDVNYYTEKAMHNRLEKLRKDLIPGYAQAKVASKKPRTQNQKKKGNDKLF